MNNKLSGFFAFSNLQIQYSPIYHFHFLNIKSPGFLGFANVYAMRVNLSVAIVAMVKDSNSTHHPGNLTTPHPGNFTTTHHHGNITTTHHHGKSTTTQYHQTWSYLCSVYAPTLTRVYPRKGSSPERYSKFLPLRGTRARQRPGPSWGRGTQS